MYLVNTQLHIKRCQKYLFFCFTMIRKPDHNNVPCLCKEPHAQPNIELSNNIKESLKVGMPWQSNLKPHSMPLLVVGKPSGQSVFCVCVASWLHTTCVGMRVHLCDQLTTKDTETVLFSCDVIPKCQWNEVKSTSPAPQITGSNGISIEHMLDFLLGNVRSWKFYGPLVLRAITAQLSTHSPFFSFLLQGLAFRKGSHDLFSTSHDRSVKVWNLDEMAYVETLWVKMLLLQVFNILVHCSRCTNRKRKKLMQLLVICLW